MTQPPPFGDQNPTPPEPQQPSQPYPPTSPYVPAPGHGTPPPPPGAWGPSPQPSGLYQAAAIVNWVVLGLIIVGTCGLGIIAAAWFVPMTIAIHNGAKDQRKHTALAVCTLLFCNVVSGILMLVEDGKRAG